MERIKDILNTQFPISFIGIVWILAVGFGMWGYADNRFATKEEMCKAQAEYQQDVREIKDDISYLVRLHIKR